MTIWIPGEPVPKARARTVSRGGRVHSFTPRKTEVYEWSVIEAAQKAMSVASPPFPYDGPLVVTITFNLQRPPSAPKKRTHPEVKPDLDNLEKAVLDGLTKAGVWRDDAQVVLKTACKRYGHPPGVSVVVSRLEEEV